ncbi:MAG: tRNA (guanosine(37)-N1)-methyltransferase TrmD [Acidobacteriia bacterium]|nr:tRNA (guanosine(37)-N1)-methyltransferase TrmD [Terriglobia bacterium]
MVRFEIITIFPRFFEGPFSHGIVRRACEAELANIEVVDLRTFTEDKHRTVDDRPFGGGDGMVLKPEPIFKAVDYLDILREDAQSRSKAVILLSPQGKRFAQADAFRLASLDRIVLICGRYEGVDERVAEHLATEELSIGDYILTGGELAAAVVVDAVTRLLPGALGNEMSSQLDSFSGPADPQAVRGGSSAGTGTLSWPQYTRPESFRAWKVPEVLLSGNHQEIEKWRRQQAIEKTARMRPDLLGLTPSGSPVKAM